MRALPPYIIEPIWQQFVALLPARRAEHPLGCHRSRIPDRTVFEKLVEVLVFGCAYERIADEICSATTLPRRRDEWITCGVMDRLRQIALEAYDKFIGLRLANVAVDCCITKAPCGGEMAGRSPVDRGKQGIKRSTAVDSDGIPLGTIAAPANRRDTPLLGETLEPLEELLGSMPEQVSVHLDRAYDSEATRKRLGERRLEAVISEKGKPAPLQATKRWVVDLDHLLLVCPLRLGGQMMRAPWRSSHLRWVSSPSTFCRPRMDPRPPSVGSAASRSVGLARRGRS
jgi:transposase